MPPYVPKSERKPQRRKSSRQSDTTPSTPPSATAAAASPSATPGRLRQYLNTDNGRNFDLTDPTTVESHLIDPDSAAWHIPAGDEPYLRDRESRRNERRRSGSMAEDINAGDVGRFKKSDFSTRATNDHDHSRKMIINVPNEMYNELVAVVNSKAFPPRDIDTLARTYLFEGLAVTHRIAQQDGLFIPHSHMAQLEALAVVNRGMKSILEYDTMLNDGCDFVRQLLGIGAKNKARAAVFELIEIARKMNSTELRDVWRRKLRIEFGYLLKGKGAQVHVGKQEEEEESGADND